MSHGEAIHLGPAVYVTRPELPPLDELVPLLEEIWRTRVLTNAGPLHERFREALSQHLGLPRLALFTNATSALIAALRQQGVAGEVITTPFSFAASAHAIAWCGATPVFADIEPHRLNLDPAAVERAITPRTSAIVPVHCFGHPCDLGAFADIARRHRLRLIYDAAHAFGVTVGGRSLLEHGDLSIVSFHATKVFNTFEGGAVVAPDASTVLELERLRNFGIVDESTIDTVGFNGKMSELNAAVGLVQLRRVHEAIAARRQVSSRYREFLKSIDGVSPVHIDDESGHNFAYFPVMVDRPYPLTRDELLRHLASKGIHCRRYFYPLLSDLPMYGGNSDGLPVASWAAQRIICLPIYPALDDETLHRITGALMEPLK